MKSSSRNLCPFCLSVLMMTDKGEVCTENNIKDTIKDIKKFLQFDDLKKQAYLNKLSDKEDFLWKVSQVDNLKCEFNDYITYTINAAKRIADPMSVNRLEKKLKRTLTEYELEEGFEFNTDTGKYFLPFVNYPEDC